MRSHGFMRPDIVCPRAKSLSPCRRPAERIVDVARTMSKALVIDMPKGWSDIHERLLAAADEVILMVTPELATLRNARMILDQLVALRLDATTPRLVLNKAGFAKTREY